MTRATARESLDTCSSTRINIALMDHRTVQPFLMGAMHDYLMGPPQDLRQPQMLTQIMEENPRADAYYPQAHYQHPPPEQPPPAQPLAPDTSDAEPRAEDSASHPSKRQRMTHTCEVCGTTYTEKRALARHRHTDQHRQRLGLPPLKKHECSVCGTQFSRRHDRMRHETERHGGNKMTTSPDSNKTPSHGRPTPPPHPSAEAEKAYPGRGCTPTSVDGDDSSVTMGEPMVEDEPSSARRVYQDSTTPESASCLPNYYDTPKSMDSSTIMGSASLTAIYEDHSQFDPTYMRNPRHGADAMTDGTASDDGDVSHVDSAVSMSSRKPSETSRAGSDYSVPTPDPPFLTRARSFELPSFSRHNKKSLITRNGKVTTVGSSGSAANWPMLCVICGSPFEDQEDDLLSHLRKHMIELNTSHFCAECQVGFSREEDLARHRTGAEHGDCGFNFPHSRPCTGHHPPLDDDPYAALTDRDSFQLSVKLRHWEQSQLQAYICQIKDLVTLQNERARDPRRHSIVSIEVAGGSNRPPSIWSNSGSIRTQATAPMDRATGSNETDIGGLARRLRNLGLRSKTPEPWNGRNRHDEPPRKSTIANTNLNKSLRKAIYRCALDRVEKLLIMGADPAVLQGDDAMLTIMALWDRASAQALIVQHTIGQQCYGARCGCALSRPTESRDPELIKALLEHGANANDRGGLCGLPVHTAAYMGKADVVRILLEYGADPFARAANSKYGSALCCAAARADLPGNVETVRLLIEHGADGREIGGPQGSAIDLARKRRQVCETGIIGKEALNPEATARLNCCDQILEILRAD